MKIGWALPQSLQNPATSLEFAKRCERLKFDSVWVYDHLKPYWLPDDSPGLDGWTLLGAVAAATERIRVGTLVTNANLRNPALLAKMAATVDHIANGRLTLGLGVGDELSRHELEAFGYRYEPWTTRIGKLTHTIQLLRKTWTGNETHFDADDVVFHGRMSPTPTGRIPIWIGGKHYQLGRLAVENADGWNLWGITFGDVARRINNLPKPSPSDKFELSWAGHINAKSANHSSIATHTQLFKNSEVIRKQLAYLSNVGIVHCVLYPVRGTDLEIVEWFAENVEWR
jgi:alkanesulfonate monooxygenase SsuD/methylene tetrahydromethanopterin reductase-like flavin-dependent oxidoreductase (luciferase family)